MHEQHRQLFSGIRTTTFWTLLSRTLGLVRDMVIAALFGLAGSGVADAFLIALRIPNLFRQLFGEGALTASYLPVLAERLESDRLSAWQLTSAVFTWLAILLAGIVLAAEAVLGGLWLVYRHDASVALLLGLSAVTFPYMLLICLSAQVSATLNALGRFGLSAFVPVVLNLALIAGAIAAPRVTSNQVAQAYLLSACVLLGGLLQVGVQWPLLRRLGFRYDYQPAQSRAALKRIAATLLPMILGLAITQINTLMDSLIAFGLSGSGKPGETIGWLGGVAYPMQQGAAAALYYGERLYQFPIGMLGIAVATVVFPLLARHAARGSRAEVGADLTLGLRLVIFLALPASLGLVLFAEPLARLLFERGQFTAHDAQRTARMIACFGSGVWAYCSLPVLVRGFYALGNSTTPVRVGIVSVLINLLLDVSLVWFLAEAGLAVATSISAAVQVVLLAVAFHRAGSPLNISGLAVTVIRSVVATALMGLAGYSLLWGMTQHGVTSRLLLAAVPLCASAVVYLSAYTALGGREPKMLIGRR